MSSVDAFVDDPPAGIAFMGRAWDDLRGYQPRTERGCEVLAGLGLLGLAPWAAGFVAFMFEVSAAKLRVAKPGAHNLSWALPRTSDLTMLAMRLAGWEIRDTITHLFGGGFPKSLDVSKAIDKLQGAKREVVGMGAASCRFLKRGEPCRCGERDSGESSLSSGTVHAMATAPATDDARKWAGWHTTLAPAAEYWILARAPLDGTVARNVLEYGTGALNIDACRTPASGRPLKEHAEHTIDNTTKIGPQTGSRHVGETDLGRWPKNAVLSCALACDGDRHSPGCPRRMLDEMSAGGRAAFRAGSGNRGNSDEQQQTAYGAHAHNGETCRAYDDAGGASRYFPTFGYFPKASDRTIPGRPDLTNKHPTHKNPEMLEWLIKLITPAGGVLLDSFMGSGTAGVVCPSLGVLFVGIEADKEHYVTACARVGFAAAAADLRHYTPKRAKKVQSQDRKLRKRSKAK